MYFYFNSEPKVFGGGTDAPTRADSGRLGLGHRAEMSQDRLEVVNFLQNLKKIRERRNDIYFSVTETFFWCKDVRHWKPVLKKYIYSQ